MEQATTEMPILYKAIYENNWSDAKAFINGHPWVLNVEFAASTGETPLHVAAKFGHVGIVEELVKLVPPQYLNIRGAVGCTPLFVAASHSGVIPIAKCLINKNSNALAIPTTGVSIMIPVTSAFIHGFNEMGRYLYSVTPLQVFKPENGIVGSSFLRACFMTGDKLDIVLDLLQRCKELLFAADISGYSTIELIAAYLPNSLNKSQLPFWKRWLYHHIKIPSTTINEHFCVDIQQDDEMNKAYQGLDLLHRFISSIYNLSGMKEICKMKLQHAQAAKILNLTCENLIFLNEEKKDMIRKALMAAVQSENVEFLLRVTKANLELLTLVTLYQNGQVFFDAVKYRKAEIFNLFPGFRFKHVVAAQRSNTNRNTLLHIAALLAPAFQLNRISGAALQMQRELQWFKAVESMINPAYNLLENDENLSPVDFFKKNHQGLRDKGEKWMKETASSCSVVGALIVTIMFTAAITVPGGNNTSGYPMFLKEKLFKVFLISDALSLFSSTTSVLTFLGILTSRYAEEDFLHSLPKKLIIGLSTLFLSIATMMIAFSATVIIMLQNNSSRLWALLPVSVLAGIPVTLFVLLQFPLLVEVISSTYGPGLFKKKVEMWP